MRSPDPSPAADPSSSIRASDADRHSVIEVLRRHTSEGRLTLEELDQRVGEVYAAKTIGQLQSGVGSLTDGVKNKLPGGIGGSSERSGAGRLLDFLLGP